MRLIQARIVLPCVALSLFAATAFSQQLFLTPQTAQPQQQQTSPSPNCVPVPGGPPCPPSLPTASDYQRGGVPTLRSQQTLPQQAAPPTAPGVPIYTLPQTPPAPLLPGAVKPPPPGVVQQPGVTQQPGVMQQPGFGQQQGLTPQPGFVLQQPAPMQRPGLVPQSPALVPQPGLLPPQPGVIPYSLLTTEGQRNEFQEFVAQSVGRYLPMFGYNLFAAAPATFAPVDNIPVTPDYLVGPGDEIMIRAWGQVDIDYRAVVDRVGIINIPRVGNVNVSGIRYQDLNGYLRNAIGRVYRNFEINVTLGQLRSIQVFVVGQARQPGNYTISSLSTLVNALFAAGGPSLKGSMRRIQLKRGERTVVEFDLYDLLLKGDKSRDAPLLSGDVIYIPPVGDLAAVSGSVNEPAIYELRGKTTLNDLIQLAGGLATTAEGRRATVERIEDRKARKVDEFTLDNTGLARALKDGDMVRIHSLSPKFENAITLRGAVASPGRYPWREGMRVRDIIPDRDALIVPDYWARQNRVPDVMVFGQQRLRLDVRRSYDEINWDYAVIERLSHDDLSPLLIPFSLSRAIVESDASNDVPLRPGDVITIFSKADFQVPVAKQTKFVRLEGEFAAPGIYQVGPGETLRQLVARIGGITPNAYLFGAEFTREATREFQQKRLDEAIDFLERDIQRKLTTTAAGAIGADDVASARLQAEGQQKLVERLRLTRANGRIVLELAPQRVELKDLPDLVLEDGDRFLVPSRSSTVSVIGSVYNQNAFLYRADQRVSDYLARAGGATRDADTGSIYVIRADGTVVSRQQSNVFFGFGGGFEGERLMPGDTVVVPEDLQKFRFTKELRDWAQIFSQFALGVAAIKILRD